MENKKIKKVKDEIIHNWTILCSGSSVDEQNNNISLFNIIETLKIDLTPNEEQQKEKEVKGWYAVPFNFWLITKLQKNIDLNLAFDIQYEITDPKDRKVGKPFGSALKFIKGHDSLRIRNQIGTFPVTESGVYKIEMSVGDIASTKFTKIGEVSFKIDINLLKAGVKK